MVAWNEADLEGCQIDAVGSRPLDRCTTQVRDALAAAFIEQLLPWELGASIIASQSCAMDELRARISQGAGLLLLLAQSDFRVATRAGVLRLTEGRRRRLLIDSTQHSARERRERLDSSGAGFSGAGIPRWRSSPAT